MAPTFPGFFDQQEFDPFSDFSSDFTGQGIVTPEPQDSFGGAISNGFLPQNYQDLIGKYAPQYGIPTDIASRMASQESGFNPSAVSNKGATGLFQILPSTAQEEAGLQNMSGYDLKNPEDSTKLGFGYLSRMYKKYGDWAKALAAYNAGPGAVDKYDGVPPYKETQQYVSNILPNYSSKSGGGGYGGGGGGGTPAYQVPNSEDGPTPLNNIPSTDNTVPTLDELTNHATTPVQTTGQLPVNQPNFLPTTGGRDANIAALQNTAKTYRGMASDFLAQAKDSSMDRGQMWANVLTPVLGAALGGIMNGKKGAKMGAAAGFTGAGAGNAIAAAETKQRQDIAERQAQVTQQSAEKADQQAFQLQSQGYAAKDRDALYGNVAARPANQPLSEGEYSYYAPKFNMSVDDLKKAASTKGDIDRMLRDRGQLQAQGRFDDAMDYKKNRGIVFGTEQIPGRFQSDKQKQEASNIMGYTNSMLGSIDALKDSVSKYGVEFIGEHRQDQATNLSALWSAARQIAKTGMRLEGREAELVNNLAGFEQFDINGIADTLTQTLMRGGPEAGLSAAENVIKRDAALRMQAQNAYIPGLLQFHTPDLQAAVSQSGNGPTHMANPGDGIAPPKSSDPVPGIDGATFTGVVVGNKHQIKKSDGSISWVSNG